jgi:biotin carboxylase
MNRRGGNTTAATKGLMIASAFTLPYHVLRTASAAGLRVHVLGSGAARGLRWSRHCRRFHESRCGGDAEVLLAEIREIARRHSIEIVFPADDVSTRLLAAVADRLPLRRTPLPDLATFDLLNDKWSFTQFCHDNGIRAPEAWLFDSVASLRLALDSGEVALPVTVKPTNRSGGFGVIHIRTPDHITLLDAADYSPLLAQRHIVGESVSITLLCERGRVVAHVGQQRDAARFRILAHSDLLDNAGRLAMLTDYDGTINFDAVVADADGLSYLVECNPRFWYSIYLVMIAGLNFVALSLANPSRTMTIGRAELRLSWRKIIARPWRATRLDWKFLAYNLGDPLAYLLLRGNSYDDSDVAVPAAATAAASRPATARLAAAASAADLP